MSLMKEHNACIEPRPRSVWRMGPVLLCAVSLLVTGCGSSDEPQRQAAGSQTESPAEVADHGDLLARVNGQPIHALDLEVTLTNMLGAEHGAMIDERVRHKVLQSLVMNSSMAQAAQKELSADEMAWIEAKTRAYRDQLLATEYLRQHSAPEPVTQEMVRAYYEEHPERFGGKRLRVYELLLETEKSDASQRQAIMQRLSEGAQQQDWKAYAAQLAAQGYAVQFRSGEVNEQLLHPGLLGLIRPLPEGQVSQVTYLGGKAHIARIVSEEHKPARPLQDVSTEIRKMLAPLQMKKAVREISDQVLSAARVEYLREPSATE
jgi:hypothetical protein